MAEKKYTDQQLSAINTRNKTLLVSAAAGSGKTATLTERIIQSLLDENKPADISKMLIVTFTNAAVAELKERITAAIKNKLLERPDDKRLEKQLFMLSGARISTIDSFCNDIFRNNAERFGISPKYRIADPIEASILSRSVLSALIDAIYDGELSDVGTADEFLNLSDSLTGVKSEGQLEDILMKLYSDAENLEEGVAIFSRFANELLEFKDRPLEENRYAAYAMESAKSAAAHFLGVYDKITMSLTTCDEELKYAEVFGYDKDIINSVLRAESYDAMKAALLSDFVKLPSIRNEKKTQSMLCAADVRANLKSTLEEIHNAYFFHSREEWQENMQRLGETLSLLGRFLEKFHSVYFEEKRARAMLEYSDIERLAYLSLYHNGEITEYARSLKEQFEAVYIDEYQDVNSLQNRIFEAVSNPDNRFMVGDIKQSIYGFRSAKPEIFADMKSRFPLLEVSGDSPFASIFMSKNFRCDKGVVDFVNGIFDVMFELAKDSIGYVKEDRLEFGKGDIEKEPPYSRPKIKVFTKEDAEGLAESGETLADLSAKQTARKIKKLIEESTLNNGAPVRPSDVAIVLRRDGGRAKKYADALREVGIRAEIPTDGTFFLNADVQLMLCLLNAIDNPKRDIYLAGLMCSPLYSFTPDEMYLIKESGKDTLWESLASYLAEHPEFEKGASFRNALLRYRALSEGTMVDTLIMRLYSETGILSLAARGGGKENLMLLYSYARAFEGSSYKGLHSFIDYVNTVISSGAKFTPKKSTAAEEAVTIITVHKSKGLEFPVVFLADAGGALLSKMESKERVAYSDSFGIAMKLRMKDGIALLENPIFNAIKDYNAARAIEEELRVYYVALTRAREQLFVVGHVTDKSSYALKERISAEKLHLSPHTVRRMSSIIDVILTSTDLGELSFGMDEETTKIKTEEEIKEEKIATIAEEEAEDLIKSISERFAYEYPGAHLTTLPEKLSISVLYPTVLDGSDGETIINNTDSDEKQKEKEEKRGILPEFITGTKEDESAKKGIATHTFLQFCNLESLYNSDAKSELSRLTDAGFLSKENEKRVRINEIELFKNSALLSEMRHAKRLFREFRFNVNLPACLFTEDEEKRRALEDREILLQGVIDCIIEDEAGNLHLIDYKTDRLTRAELADKSLAQKTLQKKHALQLSYYSLAIEKMFGKAPVTKRVYSLPLGDTVEV